MVLVHVHVSDVLGQRPVVSLAGPVQQEEEQVETVCKKGAEGEKKSKGSGMSAGRMGIMHVVSYTSICKRITTSKLG